MAKKTHAAHQVKAGQFIEEPEQGDLFLCEIVSWPVKDDLASMEIPLYSLSKQKDTKIREWRRGNRVLRIVPSSVGAATIYDKDLLLYISSQLVEARNQGLPVSKTVKVDSFDFLLGTERGDGRASFGRIIDMLRRLRGTTIETNIPTGADRVTQTEGFSMIDHFKVLSSRKSGKNGEEEIEQVYSFTVTISEWLYNGLLNYEVLTLDRGYFRLTRAIDRRLYEIARKHCGDQPFWKISIDLLAEKIGTSRARFKVRDEIRQAIEADELPQYRVALDTNSTPDDVVFYTRDSRKLSAELMRSHKIQWFETLERSDNLSRWRKPRGRKALPQPAIADVKGVGH